MVAIEDDTLSDAPGTVSPNVIVTASIDSEEFPALTFVGNVVLEFLLALATTVLRPCRLLPSFTS